MTGFPAGVFATNCYILASEPGAECIIVDPGMDAMPTLTQVLEEHRLKPVAVALTHGHLDHTWSVTPLVDGYDIPAYLHGDDVDMVANPLEWHSRGLVDMVGGDPSKVPAFDDVKVLNDGEQISIVGVELTARHTPGHTQGSVIFTFEHPEAPVMLSGDTLFQQGIGRTDLPGGSYEAIMRSIDEVCLSYDDRTVVLPGHGGQTSIGAERASNPFILQYQRDQQSRS